MTNWISYTNTPFLSINLISIARLSQEWKQNTLTGHFWRLYLNNDRGAGVILNGRRHELFPDRLYLIPPNCGLVTWVTGDPYQIFLHFEASGLLGSPDYLCNELPLSPEMKDNFARIRAELAKMQGPNVEPSLYLPAFAAISYALNHLPPEACSTPIYDERIARVCKMLHADLAAPHTTESMAAAVEMTPGIFLKHFRNATGVTPHQYLLSIRYAEAARCLKNETFDIETICERIGVNDRFHFSRTFKTLYGCTPSLYRRTRQA